MRAIHRRKEMRGRTVGKHAGIWEGDQDDGKGNVGNGSPGLVYGIHGMANVEPIGTEAEEAGEDTMSIDEEWQRNNASIEPLSPNAIAEFNADPRRVIATARRWTHGAK